MRLILGQGYRIPTTVSQRNLDGSTTLVDPTTIVGTLQLPDLTTAAFTPGKDAVGEYHADLAPVALVQVGHYQWTVITTGLGAGAQAGAFDVIDPFAPQLLTLDDARAQLNKSSGVDDDELQLYVDAATAWVERRCGAVAPRSVVEAVTARCGRLWLGTTPVLAVESATLAGVPVDVTDWSVPSPLAGFAVAGTGVLSGDYVVTYRAGRSPIPAPLQLAARMLVAHLWQTQRGGAGRTGDVATTGFGYAVPNRVLELTAPYLLPDAIA